MPRSSTGPLLRPSHPQVRNAIRISDGHHLATDPDRCADAGDRTLEILLALVVVLLLARTIGLERLEE